MNRDRKDCSHIARKARCTGTALVPTALLALFLSCGGPVCSAQSLFLQTNLVRSDKDGKPDPAAPLRETSLTFIEPPKPRSYQLHDLITIIVDEQSKQSSKQTMDTKKDYDLKGQLTSFPSLAKFLELQLENGDTESGAKLALTSNHKFKGEGTYDRTDQFTAKITASIIDIKPNGVIVIEARRSKSTDDETQTILLTGLVRQDDITTANTILSSQLAEMTLSTKNEGQVKDAADKGWIPRVLEAIFNF